ncbi:MAG: 6-hydroxynicotinate reductase, partial [Rhizobacter sp.]|nr:6-hydroxynicotinate reductase [Rhizobacter sp.]
TIEDALARGAWHSEGAPTARVFADQPAENAWPIGRPPLLG